MKHEFKPESLMMSHADRPAWAKGAIKSPIYQTSTFGFERAEEGKAFFEAVYGKRDGNSDGAKGMIYSRINNPNLVMLEEALCAWDGAEDAGVFASGMAAISTVLLEFLSPGDLLVYSRPLYSGTDQFIHGLLSKMNVHALSFQPGEEEDGLVQRIRQSGFADRLKMIYVETPANPTNVLFDIAACKKVARAFSRPREEVLVASDNTYMGPLWQLPLELGADLVMYSATKFMGGHSDLIAGSVAGRSGLLKRVKSLRTSLGNMAGPSTAWLLMRSLETLQLRMEKQERNAQKVADFLNRHERVKRVNYLGLLSDDRPREYELFQRQCKGTGAMVSFELLGGEAEAFAFLNALSLIKLAVSLGSTESLAQHPKTMTHAGVDPEHLAEMQITDALIRLSVGVEHADDIIYDLGQALDRVG